MFQIGSYKMIFLLNSKIQFPATKLEINWIVISIVIK